VISSLWVTIRGARLPPLLARLVPYALAVAGIGVATLLIAVAAYILGLSRIETYPLVYLLVIALIALRFNRGPALAATIAAALAMDSIMVPPTFTFGWHSVNDMLRLITGRDRRAGHHRNHPRDPNFDLVAGPPQGLAARGFPTHHPEPGRRRDPEHGRGTDATRDRLPEFPALPLG